MEYEEIERRFTYHPPKEDQVPRYEAIRAESRVMVNLVLDLTPESREQSLALTKLEEACFWANAAIARRE